MKKVPISWIQKQFVEVVDPVSDVFNEGILGNRSLVFLSILNSHGLLKIENIDTEETTLDFSNKEKVLLSMITGSVLNQEQFKDLDAGPANYCFNAIAAAVVLLIKIGLFKKDQIDLDN